MTTVLPHSLNPLDYPPMFQFGQTGAPCGGKSCCTDTCIQQLGQYWKEKTYTLTQIRNFAQAGTYFNHNPCTGINAIEALTALHKLGITWYNVATGIDQTFVASKVLIGPVLVGVAGGSYPNDVHGACGSINKAEHGGRTQCNFVGAHAVLAIRRQKELDGIKWILRDPNHNSSSRPEKPTFDKITPTQFNKAIKDLPRKTAFNTTFCIYPTQRKTL